MEERRAHILHLGEAFSRALKLKTNMTRRWQCISSFQRKSHCAWINRTLGTWCSVLITHKESLHTSNTELLANLPRWCFALKRWITACQSFGPIQAKPHSCKPHYRTEKPFQFTSFSSIHTATLNAFAHPFLCIVELKHSENSAPTAWSWFEKY